MAARQTVREASKEKDMGCCGRPDNRVQKGNSYAERYAYMSSHQINTQLGALSKCKSCDALTSGDPCTVCGIVKKVEAKEEKA